MAGQDIPRDWCSGCEMNKPQVDCQMLSHQAEHLHCPVLTTNLQDLRQHGFQFFATYTPEHVFHRQLAVLQVATNGFELLLQIHV